MSERVNDQHGGIIQAHWRRKQFSKPPGSDISRLTQRILGKKKSEPSISCCKRVPKESIHEAQAKTVEDDQRWPRIKHFRLANNGQGRLCLHVTREELDDKQANLRGNRSIAVGPKDPRRFSDARSELISFSSSKSTRFRRRPPFLHWHLIGRQ